MAPIPMRVCGKMKRRPNQSPPELPGFRIERGEFSLSVEFGLLPSDKLFYMDREQDKYLTMEEFTKRILDRALFPALPEQ